MFPPFVFCILFGIIKQKWHPCGVSTRKNFPSRVLSPSGFALDRQSSLGEVIPGGNPTRMSYVYNAKWYNRWWMYTIWYYCQIYGRTIWYKWKQKHTIIVLGYKRNNISLQVRTVILLSKTSWPQLVCRKCSNFFLKIYNTKQYQLNCWQFIFFTSLLLALVIRTLNLAYQGVVRQSKCHNMHIRESRRYVLCNAFMEFHHRKG